MKSLNLNSLTIETHPNGLTVLTYHDEKTYVLQVGPDNSRTHYIVTPDGLKSEQHPIHFMMEFYYVPSSSITCAA